MEAAFIFLFILVVVIAMTFAAISSQQRESEWRRFAEQVGGSYVPGGMFSRSSLELVHAGAGARVKITGGGKNSPVYTEVHLHWPDHEFRLKVFPEQMFSGLQRFLGMEDIEIGSPQFDADYVIQGNTRESVQEFLTPDVQHSIAELQGLWGNNDIFVSITRGTLLIKKQGLAQSSDKLTQLWTLSTRLYDCAAKRQMAGIEFVDGSSSSNGETSVIQSASLQWKDEIVCQICGDDIQNDHAQVLCRRCKTPHHQDCWTYYGACSTYGCGEKRCVPRKR